MGNPLPCASKTALAVKIAQLRSGVARLVFDPETETANIAPARDLPQR